MIEADGDIAVAADALVGQLRHAEPHLAIRQQILGNQGLMLLEFGHMGIAEDREPVRIEPECEIQG